MSTPQLNGRHGRGRLKRRIALVEGVPLSHGVSEIRHSWRSTAVPPTANNRWFIVPDRRIVRGRSRELLDDPERNA
jgi:hypothetical protein